MIPGVSRSGATIVSAMLIGADKRSAAEFSFFLAMPTMAGAFAYDLLQELRPDERQQLRCSSRSASSTSFVAGWIVVRSLLDYVSQPRLRAVRLVAHHRRRARADRAGAVWRSAAATWTSGPHALADERSYAARRPLRNWPALRKRQR